MPAVKLTLEDPAAAAGSASTHVPPYAHWSSAHVKLTQCTVTSRLSSVHGGTW